MPQWTFLNQTSKLAKFSSSLVNFFNQNSAIHYSYFSNKFFSSKIVKTLTLFSTERICFARAFCRVSQISESLLYKVKLGILPYFCSLFRVQVSLAKLRWFGQKLARKRVPWRNVVEYIQNFGQNDRFVRPGPEPTGLGLWGNWVITVGNFLLLKFHLLLIILVKSSYCNIQFKLLLMF